MITYGEMTKEEVPSLLRLYKQLDPDDITVEAVQLETIWGKIEKQAVHYFVARENKEIVSACYVCIIPNLTRSGKSIGFIENVVTDETYRRKGIGKKVMEQAINFAKAQNCYKIVLQSGNKRTEAHQFYQSLGFDGDSKRAFELRF